MRQCTKLALLSVMGACASLVTIASSATVALASATRICESDLAANIDAILTDPQLAPMQWGISVRPLDTHQPIVAHQADRYFVPASNVKLMTTAAALQQLGAQFRIATTLYQRPDRTHELSGYPVTSSESTQLQVVGRGDPSLSDADLAQLVEQVRSQGITQISQLWVDDTYIPDDAINPTWEWEDIQAGYGAPVNSLILNRNELSFSLVPQAVGQPLQLAWDDPVAARGWQIDNRSVTVSSNTSEWIRIGRGVAQPTVQVAGQLRAGADPETASVAVIQPTNQFLQHLHDAFMAAGIHVQSSAIAAQPLPPDAVAIATVYSPPLAKLVQTANQDSENIYAEALLRIVGRESGILPQPGDSSLALGLAAVRSELEQLGVDGSSFDLADGSGLSRRNWVTPNAFVQTLQAMADSPHAQIYRQSMAIAGVSGTLQYRFQNTPVAGQLQGKTGALSGVAALSGYLDPPQFEPLAFSIIVNHFSQPVREVRPYIDQIVTVLSQLQTCPDASER